ncbi:MAG: sigma-54 dependent transcriptional regulator [Myxococcales bacterium]|nr:sigma-54 dependent transcriptional regulator [Myxococcota bacterium]MDW8282858.1 sigma-54 dependent transcriptional regulator [Myxococcales bacterium]
MSSAPGPPSTSLDLRAYPVLVVDDEPDNLEAFCFNFKRTFRILTAQSGAEGLALLREEPVAVIVTDQRMPRMTGLEFLKEARAIAPDAVPIILTAYTDVDILIEAINLGQIYRYITKPWDAKEMRGVLVQAIERYHLRQENRRLQVQLQQYAGYLKQELHGAFEFGQLVGDSPRLREVLARVEQVAKTHSTVLLRGETGTGKELVAHAIHINSPREGKPFVRVNCAALASGVLESELFGHEKGAFTGAVTRRIGRFELADGGTLFLDEVGDLPMEVQVKLLRVLQEQEFERVGGAETVRVDVRLVSATNRDLEALVAEGKFREDLYYRLNVFPIFLPPLRERIEDIPKLVEHFLAKWARRNRLQVRGIEPQALEMLQRYSWPGNVRELENLIERALIVARGPEISVADLDFGRRGPPLTGGVAAPAVPASSPPPPPAAPVSFAPQGRSLQNRLHEQEKSEIIAAIEQSEGNIAGAARLLGINRSTLYYRLRKHGLLHLMPTRPEPEEPASTPSRTNPAGQR